MACVPALHAIYESDILKKMMYKPRGWREVSFEVGKFRWWDDIIKNNEYLRIINSAPAVAALAYDLSSAAHGFRSVDILQQEQATVRSSPEFSNASD